MVMSCDCTLLDIVLRIPWCGRFMCPFAVAGLGFKYFNTNCSLMFDHPLRKPRLTALRKVEILGLPNNWWANQTAFICVLMECVNEAMAGWSCTIGWGIAGGIIMLHFFIVNGNVHKSVDRFRGSIKISFPSYHTSTLFIWKTTMHPTLHNGWIPKRKARARFGTMCPTNRLGMPGTTTSHMCVDCTWRPSGRLTDNGFLAGCLFTTGTPFCTKTDVTPVSAMPWDTFILMHCVRGTNPATSVVGGC